MLSLHRRAITAGLVSACVMVSAVATEHGAHAQEKSREERAKVLSNQGALLIEQGRFVEAIAGLTTSIQLNAHASLPFYNRGNAYFHQQQFEPAIADYTEAIRRDPRFGLAYMNRGSAYSNLARLDEALADLTEAVRLSPDNGDAHYNLGLVLTKRRDCEKPVEAFAEAIRLNPHDPSTYRARGVAFECNDQHDSRRGRLSQSARSEALRSPSRDQDGQGEPDVKMT